VSAKADTHRKQANQNSQTMPAHPKATETPWRPYKSQKESTSEHHQAHPVSTMMLRRSLFGAPQPHCTGQGNRERVHILPAEWGKSIAADPHNHQALAKADTHREQTTETRKQRPHNSSAARDKPINSCLSNNGYPSIPTSSSVSRTRGSRASLSFHLPRRTEASSSADPPTSQSHWLLRIRGLRPLSNPPDSLSFRREG